MAVVGPCSSWAEDYVPRRIAMATPHQLIYWSQGNQRRSGSLSIRPKRKLWRWSLSFAPCQGAPSWMPESSMGQA